jgi:hypothetical protein
MSLESILGWGWVGLTTILAFVMWAAQVHPEQAASNLYLWLRWAGIKNPPDFLRDKISDKRVRRVSFFGLLALFAWGGIMLQAKFQILEPENVRIGDSPLSAKDTKIEIAKIWPNLENESQTFHASYLVGNHTDSLTTHLVFEGSMLVTESTLTEKTLGPFFTYLRARIKLIPTDKGIDINAKQESRYFTIPTSKQEGSNEFKAWNDPKKAIYSLVLLRYVNAASDEKTNLYTESCVYFFQHVIHVCESGHNKSYKGE